MAIASRQLSRLRHRTQELKAQEQELKMQELALQRETETLKAQEQKLKRQEQMLENLLFTIESRKPTTTKKEPFTLNSLLSSLKSQNMNEDTKNKFKYLAMGLEGNRVGTILDRHILGLVFDVNQFEAIFNRHKSQEAIISKHDATEAAADAFRERVFELSEFNENAIVSKRAQVVEEVNSDHQHQVELDLHHG